MADNPFASDPKAAERIEDPFEEQNPFANESAYVSPAKGYTQPESQYTTSYSSDFDETPKSKPLGSSAPAEKPKEKEKEKEKPKPNTGYSYTQLKDSDDGASSSGRGGDISERESRLLKKERELLEKERMLEQREVVARTGGGRQLYNWPSKCYPLAYHSIEEEIPPAHRFMLKKFYAVFYLSCVCLFWNWLTILTVWGQDRGSDASNSALWATVYMVSGIPGSWKLWYRSVYYGCRDSGTVRWAFFFINFLMHICFGLLMAIGVPKIGAGGLFIMIDMFANSHDIAGIFCLVDAGIWTINVLTSIYLLKKSYQVWKLGGGPGKASQAAAKALIEHHQQQQEAARPETSV